MPIALRPLALAALTLALLHGVVAVYFTAEVVPVPTNRETTTAPLTPRVVLLVVDGLRYDTALTSGAMPQLMALAARGAGGLALASQVTMTGVGVRCIGTGVSPGLADLLRNIDLPPVEFDNLFARLAERGGRAALVGDRPAWMGLFGRFIAIDETVPAESSALHFLNNVDGADRLWVARAETLMARRDWQLAVIMLGGIDHASHRFTPFGAQFLRKAHDTDGDLARIVAAAGSDTTFIITSDHGAGDRGHHGSGEPVARRTPLVLVGPAVRAGVQLDARQIDIAPTLATLLGLPLPAPSEGRVLIEALDVPADLARHLAAANVRQLQRYADAYATARGLAAPSVNENDLHVVSDWLDEVRSRASLVPLAWALSLALIAAGLVVGGWTAHDRRVRVGHAVAAAVAAASLASSGRAPMFALAALAVAAAATFFELRPSLPSLGRGALAAVAALAVLELLIGAWRLHRRAVELAAVQLAGALHLPIAALFAGGTAASLAVLALAAKRVRAAPLSTVSALYLLCVVAAAGDALALPVGIGAGVVAAWLCARGDERLAVLAPLGVGATAALVVDSPLLARAHLDLAAPLLVVLAVAATLAPRRRPLLVFALFAVGATVVHATGDPPLAFRLLLGAGGAALVLVAALDSWEMLGFAAALLLATLSRSAQIPGLIAWTLCAAAAGRLGTVREGSPGGLACATLLAVSVRLGLFALFEGAFEANRLEIWVGYVGNPGTTHLFGGALVALKFALPTVLALALVCAHQPRRARFAVVGWLLAFWFLRVLHVVLSMTIARGTFYSPYVDAGHLMYLLLFVASTAAAAAALATAGS